MLVWENWSPGPCVFQHKLMKVWQKQRGPWKWGLVYLQSHRPTAKSGIVIKSGRCAFHCLSKVHSFCPQSNMTKSEGVCGCISEPWVIPSQSITGFKPKVGHTGTCYLVLAVKHTQSYLARSGSACDCMRELKLGRVLAHGAICGWGLDLGVGSSLWA